MASMIETHQDIPSAEGKLSCQNLCFKYQKQLILNNISFNIIAGQFIGLIGPNGAGKSTLLRCLYRYLLPTSGDVLYDGTPIASIKTKLFAQQVAVVVQELPNQFNLRVYDVVSLGLVPYQNAFAHITQPQNLLIAQAIEQVGLSTKTHQSYESLSGGEKQRVLIAKAIVQKPRLLIMDEPTSHLDINYQLEIMHIVKSLGITVIASFHDLNLASAMSDEIMLLAQGELAAKGSPELVITQENLKKHFNVNALVNQHPQNNRPLVIYQYHDNKTDKDNG